MNTDAPHRRKQPMKALADTINNAFASRGLLPMDGHCSCPICNRDGLNREDMMATDDGFWNRVAMELHGKPICNRPECADVLDFAKMDADRRAKEAPKPGYVTCDKCKGDGGRLREYDYVRKEATTQWCTRCNGDGVVYRGLEQADDLDHRIADELARLERQEQMRLEHKAKFEMECDT